MFKTVFNLIFLFKLISRILYALHILMLYRHMHNLIYYTITIDNHYIISDDMPISSLNSLIVNICIKRNFWISWFYILCIYLCI